MPRNRGTSTRTPRVTTGPDPSTSQTDAPSMSTIERNGRPFHPIPPKPMWHRASMWVLSSPWHCTCTWSLAACTSPPAFEPHAVTISWRTAASMPCG